MKSAEGSAPTLLSLHVVLWNSARVLPTLLASLSQQRFRDFSLVLIDNASSDDSVAVARRLAPEAAIALNSENRGFCAAHNQAIRMSETPFVALVNPDLALDRNALSVLMTKIQALDDVGSIGGKILKFNDTSGSIDSAGILATRFREFVNRGEGERDQGQYDTPGEVFGLSGAFCILRRAALEQIRIGQEYLDEDLFMYKDDVDLAWRLRLAGWKNWYEPAARIYHVRTAQHEALLSVASRRRRKRPLINRLSYRNHLLVLVKNDSLRSWFLPWPRVPLFELMKLFFLPFFERSSLAGALDLVRLLPRFLRKRRIVQRSRAVSPQTLNIWFT